MTCNPVGRGRWPVGLLILDSSGRFSSPLGRPLHSFGPKMEKKNNACILALSGSSPCRRIASSTTRPQSPRRCSSVEHRYVQLDVQLGPFSQLLRQDMHWLASAVSRVELAPSSLPPCFLYLAIWVCLFQKPFLISHAYCDLNASENVAIACLGEHLCSISFLMYFFRRTLLMYLIPHGLFGYCNDLSSDFVQFFFKKKK